MTTTDLSNLVTTTVISTTVNDGFKLPIPLWSIALICAILAFILILICCCICRCYCCKKKKKKSKYHVDLSHVQVLSDSYGEKVQPDLNELSLLGLQRLLSYGRLHYSLDYNYKEDSLSVGVIELADIQPIDKEKTYDPYVRVQMYPDMKKFETKVIKKSLNPIFNKQFLFKVAYENVKSKDLIFLVLHYDRFSKHEIIGQAKIKPNITKIDQVIDEWVELGPPDLSLQQEDYLGDICISLRYVPTSGKLSVLVIEAKSIKRMDSNGLSDPYVKLSLYLNNKRIKKKKSSTKKCTINPYYNEEFIFEVPFDQIQKVMLVISVIDYDRITHSDLIGEIKLGCQSHGSQLRHWSDMLSNLGKATAQWHALNPARK